MVGSPIKYIYSAVFKAFLIDDLEVEFIEEFWLLYLLLVEIFEDGEVYKVFIISVNLHLMFDTVKIRLLFFEWFDDDYQFFIMNRIVEF